MTSRVSGTAEFGRAFVRASLFLLPMCAALAMPMTASGQTATIFAAYWSGAQDADHDGCPETSTLNWDPDVSTWSASLNVYEKIYRRASGSSGAWSLVLTTTPHIIVGMTDQDIQSVAIPGVGTCGAGTQDYKIEIYRYGVTPPVTTPDFTADRTSQYCSALGSHAEEIPPPLIVTDTDALGVPEGGTADLHVKLSGPPLAAVTVCIAWIAGDGDITVQSSSCLLDFTSANWNTEQPVTLAAKQDADAIDGQAAFRLSASGLANKDIRANEIDDEIPPDIVTDMDSISVPEEGPTVCFRVKLTRPPASNVIIQPSIVGPPEGDPDPAISLDPPVQSVTITPANWNTFQGHDICLKAVHDDGCTAKTTVIRCTACCADPKDVVAVKEDDDGNCGPCSATRAFFAEDSSGVDVAPDMNRPMTCFVRGQPIWVQIMARPNYETVSFAVEDMLPAGWFVDADHITNGGRLDVASVKWAGSGHLPVSLMYRAIAPDSPSCSTFSGEMSCDGASETIGGLSDMCPCSFHPADTSWDWALSAAEFGAYAGCWLTPNCRWLDDPNPIDADYMTRAGYLWQIGCGGGYYYDDSEILPVMRWQPEVCPAGASPAEGALGTQVAATAAPAEAPLETTDAVGTFTRTIQPPSYTPGVPVHVSVAVLPDAGAGFYMLEEAPPSGWQVTNINEGGTWDNGNKTVKWWFLDGLPRTLSYDAWPPSDASGVQTFGAEAGFGGPLMPVGGQTSIGPVVGADFDADGDVDLTDFLRFQQCFNGPNRAFKVQDPPCGNVDLDQDTDVDTEDFLDFQKCFNGPNRPPKC